MQVESHQLSLAQRRRNDTFLNKLFLTIVEHGSQISIVVLAHFLRIGEAYASLLMRKERSVLQCATAPAEAVIGVDETTNAVLKV